MGRLGRTPILQVGGVQEAKTVAPPRLLRAVAELVPVVLVMLLKAATSGLVVLQVRGGVSRGVALEMPYRVSTAVAVMDAVPPLFRVIEFPSAPSAPIWR